ncbi:MAG TPA: hypothetical protein VF458_00420 [Ktedonobacteraceae bacterium]
MPEHNAQSLRRLFFWFLVGFCCLVVSACGGNTVNIYDNARVLDTAQVRDSAAKVSKNVNVYTFNDFHGKQEDFYPWVTRKLAVNTNTVLLVIDTVHPSLYILRGGRVNLSRSDMSQINNSFRTTYGSNNGNYTGATISALNSLQDKLSVNHASPLLPLLWLIPLVVLVGAFFFVFQKTRRPHYG